VPGSAAFTDGRGKNSMRLNFSGVTVDEIREGVMRIGEVIGEQVALYETLTSHPVEPPESDDAGGDVVPMRRR
jgi:2-aminoadipate transaminase